MTIIWLIVWVASGAPHVELWNSWAIGLAVCAGIDIVHK